MKYLNIDGLKYFYEKIKTMINGKIFPITAATSTAPSGARVGDYLLNSGTATYTIAGVSTAIGGLVKITQLNPLVGVAAGNIRGAQGEKGADGAQGIQGIKGDKGDKGDTGAQGVQGIQGPKGDTGIQGVIGPQGPAGVAPSNVVTTDTTQTVSGVKTFTGASKMSTVSNTGQIIRNIGFGTSATPTGSTNDVYMQYS